MSGTSADGVDVALVHIPDKERPGSFSLGLELLGHAHFPYPHAVRAAVLSAMNAGHASVADLSRLNFLLGHLYADAVMNAKRAAGVRQLELIGCHGQTLYHQGEAATYCGKRIACTRQTGEAA